MIAPTLHTKRLTLRPYRLDDFDAYCALLTSDRAKYMQAGLDRKGAWNWFTSDVAHWPLFGFGALMIDVSATGECVGAVALGKGITFPETELGWQLYDGQEGKGYATEAATALKTWAFATLPLDTLVSYIDPENAASVSVAKRLGGHLDLAAVPAYAGDLVYRYARAS